MSFAITIDQFEGPLDLMLHLIKQNKLDLFDLNMDTLTDQYIQYLQTMDALKLEVASEYLLELSILLEYKSKKLLPREEVVIEEQYEEDQRELLINRLLEYQKYKSASEMLLKKYELRQLQWGKPMSEIINEWAKPKVEEDLTGNPYELVKAMNKVLRRLSLKQPLETKIITPEISIDEQRFYIRKKMAENKSIQFNDLCKECDSIQMIIVSFLSILDLIRSQELVFHIDESQNIWLMKGSNYAGI